MSHETLEAILRDMRLASDAIDEACGPSDYNKRLVALALIARHYLRTRDDVAASQPGAQTGLIGKLEGASAAVLGASGFGSHDNRRLEHAYRLIEEVLAALRARG